MQEAFEKIKEFCLTYKKYIGACALFIAFVADDTIKNEDDVERYLQLSTIGVIPDIKQTQKNSNRNGGHHHA